MEGGSHQNPWAELKLENRFKCTIGGRTTSRIPRLLSKTPAHTYSNESHHLGLGMTRTQKRYLNGRRYGPSQMVLIPRGAGLEGRGWDSRCRCLTVTGSSTSVRNGKNESSLAHKLDSSGSRRKFRRRKKTNLPLLRRSGRVSMNIFQVPSNPHTSDPALDA